MLSYSLSPHFPSDYVRIFTSEAEPTGEKDVSVVNVPFTRYEEQDEEEVEQSMALLVRHSLATDFGRQSLCQGDYCFLPSVAMEKRQST